MNALFNAGFRKDPIHRYSLANQTIDLKKAA